MNEELRRLVHDLESSDDKIRMDAVQTMLTMTDQKVDWVYEVWDGMIAKLAHENSYQRSIGIMLLCNLAKSDDGNRMANELESLLAHTKDEKFITSRQCLQNIWKSAITNDQNREKIIDHLVKRYRECLTEKHYNLVRLDVIQAIKNIYDKTGRERLPELARELIAEETDAGNRKKYEAVWQA